MQVSMKFPTPPLLGQGGDQRVLCQKAPPQGWGIFLQRTRDLCITWWFSMVEKKVLLCLIKRKYRCPTWGFRSIQGDSPKNLAPGVRLYTIDFGKSPPIPGRGGVGHFIDTCINIQCWKLNDPFRAHNYLFFFCISLCSSFFLLLPLTRPNSRRSVCLGP